MIMTIAVPALLFIWFIGAFLWDGDSFKQLRNGMDRHHAEPKPAVTQPAHEEGGEHLK